MHYLLSVCAKRQQFENLLFVSLLFVFTLFSCNPEKNPHHAISILDKWHDSVTHSLADQPGRILEIADTALKIINRYDLADSLTAIWLEVRTNAMLSLNEKDSALKLLIEVRQKARAEGTSYLIICANLSLGEKYLDDGKNKLADKCIREGFSWAERYGDKFLLARANNLMGSLQRAEGNYHESQDYLFRALSLFEKQHRFYAVGPVCTNIALNYQATGDSLKSRKFMLKALEIAKSEKDTVNILASINNLTVLYRLFRPDSAAYYCHMGLSLTKNPVHWFQLLPLKFNLGNLYQDRMEPDTANTIFNEVLAVCEKNKIPAGVARCYNSIASIHEARNQDETALRYYQKAYAIADSIGDPQLMTTFLFNLRYMYQKMKNFEKALQISEKYQVARDSALTLEKHVAVHELELLYNTEKAENENQRLSQSISQMKTRIRNIYILLAIGLLVVVAVSFFTLLVYRLYQQRDLAYNTLFDQLKTGSGPELLLKQIAELTIPVNADQDNKVKPAIQDIITWLETEKPYLDCNLKLEQVAKKFNMNKIILSNGIYHWSGMHFNAFLNKYRVAEALRLLSLPESRQYKIETIALRAVFGSRASFYEAFTRITGTRPSHYRNEEIA